LVHEASGQKVAQTARTAVCGFATSVRIATNTLAPQKGIEESLNWDIEKRELLKAYETALEDR
jgi:hypothetical protein